MKFGQTTPEHTGGKCPLMGIRQSPRLRVGPTISSVIPSDAAAFFAPKYLIFRSVAVDTCNSGVT